MRGASILATMDPTTTLHDLSGDEKTFDQNFFNFLSEYATEDECDVPRASLEIL
jgi:hypothetical protein